MPLIIEILLKRSTALKFACVRLQCYKTECSSIASSALSKPNTPVRTGTILLVEIQI